MDRGLYINKGNLEDMLRDLRVGDMARPSADVDDFMGYIRHTSEKYGISERQMTYNWYAFQASKNNG